MMFQLPEGDRLQYVPTHVGSNVLPNFLLFQRMVRWATRKDLIAVKDLTFGHTAGYAQILTDILDMRNALRKQLSPEIIKKIDEGGEVFINLLATPGYEFTIGFIGLIALGAAVSPLSPEWPAKEAAALVDRAGSLALLSTHNCLPKAKDITQAIRSTTDPNFTLIEVQPHIMNPPLSPDQIFISSNLSLDLNGSGLIIFTSGTTGPPKGAVRRRSFFIDHCMHVADNYDLARGDSVLHQLPVHHITGVGFTLMPFLLTGGCIEFKTGGFDVAFTWERIAKGGLCHLSGVPTIYMRLMQYYEQKLACLPPDQLKPYVDGIQGMKQLFCGTSALPRPLQEKWTKLRGGRRILTRYGGTEFGSGFITPVDAKDVPPTSVGIVTPGVDLKLENGDEGEILMKSPFMFSRYVKDPKATEEAHTPDGYYKTGDIGRREGKYYFILGRASVDIMKSGGYKISALDVEREILGLPYISEVMVVGVEDEEFGERVAAAVVLKDRKELLIDELRRDLRNSLPGYQMPTVLRIVQEIPKNATGKVMKKVLRPQVFPPGGHPDIQRWQRSAQRAPEARL